MPRKEGSDPVLALLVENLDWMNPSLPKGIAYDFDGYNVIKTNGPGDEIYLSGGSKYSYRNIYEISYRFDKSFRLVNGLDWKKFNKGQSYKINKNDVDIDKVEKEIYEFVDPVLKANDTKPLINLQWVFNWYYQDIFN